MSKFVYINLYLYFQTVVKTILILCAAFFTCCHTQDYDDWIRSSNELGTDLTFPCSNVPHHPKLNDGDSPISENAQAYAWMLPNLTMVDCGISFDNIEISDNCSHLTVYNFEREDIGLYHCMLHQEDNDDIFMVKWGLNVRGPYFDDLWKKYDSNTLIAFSTAGIFTFLVIAICLIYQYRYIEDNSDEEAKEEDKSDGFYDNMAF